MNNWHQQHAARTSLNYNEIVAAAAAHVAEVETEICNPVAAADYLRPIFANALQEEVWVICLTAKNTVINCEMVTRGLVDRSQAHAREVFRAAIASNACKVMLAHNHPSGNPAPSAQDIAATRALIAAGVIIGIPLMDHIIVGRRTPGRYTDYVSMREAGLLEVAK